MKLSELCEPIFSYICDIRRLSRKGIDFSHQEVKQEITNRLNNASDVSTKENAVAHQFSLVKLPLIFFIDYIIKESTLSFAAEWSELAYDYNELSGDEKFFDMLDDILNDPSGSATECLQVYYSCLALGFRGCYIDDPNTIQRRLKVCALRLGYDLDDSLENQLLCPELNDSADTTKKFNDSRQLIIKVMLCGMVLLVAAFVMNIITFSLMTSGFKETLDSIVQDSPANQNHISQ